MECDKLTKKIYEHTTGRNTLHWRLTLILAKQYISKGAFQLFVILTPHRPWYSQFHFAEHPAADCPPYWQAHVDILFPYADI